VPPAVAFSRLLDVEHRRARLELFQRHIGVVSRLCSPGRFREFFRGGRRGVRALARELASGSCSNHRVARTVHGSHRLGSGRGYPSRARARRALSDADAFCTPRSARRLRRGHWRSRRGAGFSFYARLLANERRGHLEYTHAVVLVCQRRGGSHGDLWRLPSPRCFDPYAAFLGDDDILITPALEKSVEFLDEHLEFNAAWGRAIKIRLESEVGAHGRIVKCVRKTQPVVDGASACQRLLNWSNFGTDVIFAVHRTECFVNLYLDKDTYLIEEQYAHGGFPTNVTSVISGNIKELPKLYLIRQTHSQRARFSKDYSIIGKRGLPRNGSSRL